MKKRDSINQKFSTFVQFTEADNITSVSWQVDVELERHIKKIRQSDCEAKEQFWALYFLKSILQVPQVEKEKSLLNNCIYQDNQLENSRDYSLKAEKHLFAYLQESCLWAAYKVYKKFTLIRYKYPLEECFQIACIGAKPSKLFKNFNLNYSNNINSYAVKTLIHFIQNTIYSQDIETKSLKYSDYGLLKDLTKIELKTAFLWHGITQQEIDLYCIAWKCFDDVYSSNKLKSSRSLNSPNSEQIKQICFCYNLRLQQLNISAIPASEEKIQQMLSTCIKVAREYRTKRFTPLDDYENIHGFQTNILDNIIQEERWEQVLFILSQIFLSMPEAGQIMIKLCKGFSLTQSEVANILKDKYCDLQKQYQVARQLAKYNRNILKDFLMQWQLVEPDMPLNNEKDIENIKEALDECLQLYIQKILNDCLELIISELKKENNARVNEQNNQAIIHPNIKNRVIIGFIDQLEQEMSLRSNSLESVEDKITIFVDEWLKAKSYSLKY
ncbi:hypothetical protein DSM106972_008410 [Dulcicalothrix desertica PCC 7102]|uniref:RNA polymerase sigma-70 region 4 domain-containing protein n=1 Tax=Dulcicalothrix desertica PCC 7102 TaxID=232991 RepID=A0A3S1AQM4_9CYAN|nr:sigma-70 family RNA polymerase sigma factor [Dulcicalothrix desertica]RUT08788.1 hypothetical protein DSM106972_008410 [Dulcicalothrix desertica PCC 7102]TWH44195.1 RNA polymerase sigma factor (sigma-70 family) [Dulcicalothrix desertica PCC 7102]